MTRLVGAEPMARRLQAMSRASMRHRVTLETLESIRLPNGEYTDAWVSETEQPGLLVMGSATAAELGAARGVTAQGTLRLELGKTCTPGQRALICGVTRGTAWQRLVSVTSGTDLTSRLFGLATVVDVDLNA